MNLELLLDERVAVDAVEHVAHDLRIRLSFDAVATEPLQNFPWELRRGDCSLGHIRYTVVRTGIFALWKGAWFGRSGPFMDEDRSSNKRTLDLSPYGKCDWVTGTQTNPVIREGSRSKWHSEPKRAQLRHYLWAAKQLYGLDATGELHLRKGNVERVEPDHAAVERDHARLRALLAEPMPQPKRIPICKGCTNRDWCWE